MKRSAIGLAMNVLGILCPPAILNAQGRQNEQSLPNVSGVVYDSIAGTALRGASIQIVGAADRVLGQRFTAIADSTGHFAIRNVLPGRYLAGFQHPRLDSLGLEIEERVITVTDGTFRLDLATPSSRTYIALVCPDETSGSLLVGHVRQVGTQAPLVHASVVAVWSELDTTNVFTAQRNRERSIRTSPTGWFALCGLPNDVAVLARAAAGNDSSGYVRFGMPAVSVRVTTFHVGGAVRVTSTGGDRSGVGSQVAWSGSARLSGIVRDERGQPLPNARILVWGTAAETTTDSRGRFTLGDLPGGTQTVDVRAIGFQSVERVVALAATEPVSLDVALRDRVTELAGVNVRATAERARLKPFYERMRDSERGINHGYFITQEEIERRKPAFLTQLLENLPTVRVFRGIHPLDDMLLSTNRCRMTVYLDNIRIVNTLGGTDEKVNRLVPPSHVAAIEVYPRSVTAPPQYQPLNGTCGVVLIWTK